MPLDWLADSGDEKKTSTESSQQAGAWKVLIVDDEEEVHRVTRLALRRFHYDGRPVEIMMASSGADARELLSKTPDVAVIFLDVVMETDDAGLQVIDYIRNELKNHLVRIIVRTGQAGRAPEISIVTKYDINGYREKTELTSDKLMSQLYTALSSYRDLVALNYETNLRKEAANKLVRQYAQLQEANRRLEHFAKAASHDLQEPVRKIQIWSDKLVALIEDDKLAAGQDIAGKLIMNAQIISNMVNELRDVAMLEMEQPDFDQRIDLGELLVEVTQELQSELQQTFPEFQIDMLPEILADRASIKLLFSNIIRGIALCNPGHSHPRVEIRQGAVTDSDVELLVRDDGEGITPSELDKLFEPYSGVVINGISSRGMGLYLARRIVDVHNGEITASSEVGRGTEVRIRLPLKQTRDESN